MAKLKPCPFCGCEAVMQYDSRWPGDEDESVAAFEVICTNYECPIYRADNTYFLSENEAIEAWNRRCTDGA